MRPPARACLQVFAFFYAITDTCLASARDNMNVRTVRPRQAVTAPTSVDGPGDTAQQLLQAHNAERSRLGLKPLAWSDRLAAGALAWAEQLARMDDLEHSDDDERDKAGENLWMGSKGDFTPRQMVGGFIDERKDFIPGTFPDVSRTGDWVDVGHYTQLIWPETREVGCGIARNRQSEVLVCRYFPAGNIDGEDVP